jgi:hypothetical protein
MEENEQKKMDLDNFLGIIFFQMKHDETIQVAHCLVIEPPGSVEEIMKWDLSGRIKRDRREMGRLGLGISHVSVLSGIC